MSRCQRHTTWWIWSLTLFLVLVWAIALGLAASFDDHETRIKALEEMHGGRDGE